MDKLDKLMGEWLAMSHSNGNAEKFHPLVYIITDENPEKQTLFSMDFCSFGKDRVGVYRANGPWVATLSFEKDGDMCVGVELTSNGTFTPADAFRLMKTFTASHTPGGDEDFVITPVIEKD